MSIPLVGWTSTSWTEKWKSKFTSKVVRGDDAPVDISIDLAGARQVSLMVDFADRGDVLDHANWLDAAFTK